MGRDYQAEGSPSREKELSTWVEMALQDVNSRLMKESMENELGWDCINQKTMATETKKTALDSVDSQPLLRVSEKVIDKINVKI